MVLFLSLVFAVSSTMVGEVWSGIAESFRIGNGHMTTELNDSCGVGTGPRCSQAC